MQRVFSWWPVVAAAALVGATGATLTTGAILDAASESDPAAFTFPVVHGPDGRILDASLFASALPSFEQRYLPEERQAWEPTIGIGPDGALYYQASTKPTTARTGIDDVDALGGLHPELWRSDDAGLTWSDVSPQIDNILREIPLLGHQTSLPSISGDPFVHVDPISGHVLQYHQQSYLFCDDFFYSDTRGETWGHHDTCVDYFVNDDSYGDHPTLTMGPARAHDVDRIAYFCASSGCRSSVDGGASWSAPTMPFDDCEIQLGHVEVGPEGNVYVPRKACGGAQLAVSEDDGATWRVALVDDTVWTTAQEPWEGHDHDSAVAADDAGNLYYLWMSDAHMPYLAVSADAGRSWSAPIDVAAPGVTYGLFPAIVAGAEGRIALTYFATDVPSGERDDPDAVWRQYVTISVDALAAEPAFATTLAHEITDAVRRGPCINFRCYIAPGPMGNGVPNEAVGDFLDIDIDPATGFVVIAIVDLCNDACAEPDGTPADPASNRAAVSVQSGGARMRE